MVAINITADEETELIATLEVADPPHFSTRQIGNGPVRPTIVSTWDRTESLEACGVTVQCVGYRDESDNVEVPQQTCWDCLDENGSDPTVAISLGNKLITAAGELPDSNRRFSLRHSFSRVGMGR